MTTRTELESKIVQLTVTERTGPTLFTALCEDGSAWVRLVYFDVAIDRDGNRQVVNSAIPWLQLHPPHRAPEVKAPPPATKILRFSELTDPGAYWVRFQPNAKWLIADLRRRRCGWVLIVGYPSTVYRQSSEFDVAEAGQWEYVGPLPKPEVGT